MSAVFLDPDEVTRRLTEWARAELYADAEVSGVRRLPGHSGISYVFTVHPAERRFVIRFAPPGVRGSEGADVVRQAPVLTAAAEGGVPVPAVRAWNRDGTRFGAEYLVVDFVEGRSIGDLFVPGAAPAGDFDVTAVFRDAVRVLAAVHRVDCRSLRWWDRPRDLTTMIDYLVPALRRAEDPSWLDHGLALRQALLDRLPRAPRIGLLHNDFYSNNWIVGHDDRIAAVLDWETSCLGPVGADVGWLCMMYDPPSWADSQRRSMGWHPTPDDLLHWYAEAGGPAAEEPDWPSDANWYRAFAGFRLVSGTCHYLRLHRKGYRVDATWEHFADSVPALLTRAMELLHH
ncbi:phosphotransferase family protein [Acrocarpospora catenulata]|uniref:phosphotransferase family protein n=1 Tax=Acrocarpospora catenulata TaxID=2836182 RepID=UPI001BD9194C|nr:phosphotransferase family protein [Acrocarpospora catenulata]